jgi:hypothetical protein
MSQQQQSNNINVAASVTVGEIKVQFTGSPELVLSSIISFLSKQVPSLDLAQKISLSYSSADLIEAYSQFVKITPEGPRVIPDQEVRLSDKDIVALQLVASKIAKDLGRTQTEAMQVSELQAVTGLNPKSISSRISEMLKAGHVVRDEAESSKYKVTTAGIHWLDSVVSKKTRPSGH